MSEEEQVESRVYASQTEWERAKKFAQEGIYDIPAAFRCRGASSSSWGQRQERGQVQVPDAAFIMWGNAPDRRPLMYNVSDPSAAALIRHGRPAPPSFNSHCPSQIKLVLSLTRHSFRRKHHNASSTNPSLPHYHCLSARAQATPRCVRRV